MRKYCAGTCHGSIFPSLTCQFRARRFEQEWDIAGEELRSILRSGSDVLVHCRGGLGRAGTIAARLLVELGLEPAMAIASVRRVRPGAIETSDQEKFVLNIGTARN